MFKKIRSVKIPYRRQGLIYFTCRNYENQPSEVKDKIRSMCSEIGGKAGAGYSEALLEVMTGEKSVAETAGKHYINEKTLYRMRKMFYESW